MNSGWVGFGKIIFWHQSFLVDQACKASLIDLYSGLCGFVSMKYVW